MSYRYIAGIAAALMLCPAQAAEWRECERAKIRQLDLQQKKRHAAPSKKSRKSSARTGSGASIEQLDEWLWKNCREYSYELRDIEQQRM